MSSLGIILVGVIGFGFGWFIYANYACKYVFKLDADFNTPGHAYNDEFDYVPTNKYVLFGHHFTSIAGAAPIVGPAIAVYWGWLPAALWVAIGTVFFAGIHDLGALWASTRQKGKSIGALSETVIGKRTRTVYMIVVFLVLLMVNSVFGVVIANSMINSPTAVLPACMAILIALLVGQILHRTSISLLAVIVFGVIALYSSIYLGSIFPLHMPGELFSLGQSANWILVLFAYGAIASMLPVWVLLQPRDFINGIQLFVCLAMLYGAVIIALPDITAPMINTEIKSSTPSIIPILFVTVACGAVSGFHGIVSSGTSSKQLDKETDAKFVGYLSALGEGALALITIITVSGAALAATPTLWHETYSHFGSGGVKAFIVGGATLISDGWGLSVGFGETLLAVMVVLFAGTTMDSGIRLQRYIIQEWGEIYKLKILQHSVIATLVAVGMCLIIAFGAGGASGSGGMVIWPLFGSTNQLLASMTLLIISMMLMKLHRPAWITLVPMTFVLIMASIASIITLIDFIKSDNYLLACINFMVVMTTILILLEAWSAFTNFRYKKEAISYV